MLFAAITLVCCATAFSDSSPVPGKSPEVQSDQLEPAHTDAPNGKISSLASSHAEASAPENSVSIPPMSQPFSRAPIKSAVEGTYESARQRKIWYGFVAASSGAAAWDAWTTRRAVSGGYGVEGDPLLRPFARSNAIYAATQASPAIMDYLGHRMMTSHHEWMRRFWWVPQIAGTSFSLGAGIHNYRMVP